MPLEAGESGGLCQGVVEWDFGEFDTLSWLFVAFYIWKE